MPMPMYDELADKFEHIETVRKFNKYSLLWLYYGIGGTEDLFISINTFAGVVLHLSLTNTCLIETLVYEDGSSTTERYFGSKIKSRLEDILVVGSKPIKFDTVCKALNIECKDKFEVILSGEHVIIERSGDIAIINGSPLSILEFGGLAPIIKISEITLRKV